MRKVAGLIRIAYIIGRMYENILEEDIIKECGRALNQRGGQVIMMINHYLLQDALD